METARITVAPGIELTADTWQATAPDPDRPAFVLVHGLASNARLWDGVAARLVARGWSAITVDLRGHGRSSKPDGPYDVPTVADDLAVLIGALGLDRPVVAGQSWGGNVALELANRHPDLVRGVAGVDGGWFEPGTGFPSWEACLAALAPPRLAGRQGAELEGYIRRAHPDWPEIGIAGTMANFDWRPDGTIAPWLTYDRHIAVLRGMWEHRPTALYASIAVPVLLIPAVGPGPGRAAEREQAVEAAAAAIPSARVRTFTGDHDIHAQRPDEVADVLIEMVVDGFFV
ncbi:MAG: alpha/beta hydrolase [Chloroflexota bacterium]